MRVCISVLRLVVRTEYVLDLGMDSTGGLMRVLGGPLAILTASL